jgi:hypothetical protein
LLCNAYRWKEEEKANALLSRDHAARSSSDLYNAKGPEEKSDTAGTAEVQRQLIVFHTTFALPDEP